MPCKKKGKKHTPIVSEKQRGAFGSALSAKKAGRGKPSKTPVSIFSMSIADLRSHLKESGGKKLPKRAKGRKKK